MDRRLRRPGLRRRCSTRLRPTRVEGGQPPGAWVIDARGALPRCGHSRLLAPPPDALGVWAVLWDVARLPRCVASQRAVDSLTYQAYLALSWSRVLQVGGLPLMPFAFLLPPQLHVVFHILVLRRSPLRSCVQQSVSLERRRCGLPRAGTLLVRGRALGCAAGSPVSPSSF